MPRLIAAACLVFVAITNDASARKRVPPPAMSDLATVWVGSEANGSLEYFRLELDEQGQGLLTVQWLPNQPAQAYRVAATRLDKYSVEFTLQPIDAKAEPMYLRGTGVSNRLTLEAGGTTLD